MVPKRFPPRQILFYKVHNNLNIELKKSFLNKKIVSGQACQGSLDRSKKVLEIFKKK